MSVRFNINDEVWVKPTPKGIAMIAAYCAGLKLEVPDHLTPNYDGAIRMPMWEVMHIFGSETYMGPETPIETEIRFA